jgi:hypothetical protein
MLSAAGAHHRASEEELRLIRDAGFVPKQQTRCIERII